MSDTSLATDGVELLRHAIREDVLIAVAQARNELLNRGHPKSRQILYVDGHVPSGRPPMDALLDQWLNPHRVVGPGSTMVVAEQLRPIAEALLGAPPVLFQDLVLVKRPGQRPFPWHQDFPFWPVDKPDGVVIWVPLTETDVERGGLQFARASHCLGARPVVDLHVGTPQDVDADLGFDPDAFELVSPRYRRGDAVAFLPTTFHTSPPMRVQSDRPVWVTTWLAPSCRWQHSRAPHHKICTTIPDGEFVTEMP